MIGILEKRQGKAARIYQERKKAYQKQRFERGNTLDLRKIEVLPYDKKLHN
jgi:hypothetical protein